MVLIDLVKFHGFLHSFDFNCKDKMSACTTEATDNFLRNKVSLALWVFLGVKRRFAEQTDAQIFDFHSSSVDEWKDIRRVVDKVLFQGLMSDGGPVGGGVKRVLLPTSSWME
jgi:hypothetical protein